MRRSDEARSRCNPVAMAPASDHPFARNEDDTTADNITVN